MKRNLVISQTISRVIVAVICFLVPAAIWILYGASSFAASEPVGKQHSLISENQGASPTPRPAATRSPAWKNTKLSGSTGGLPPTSAHVEKGAGSDDYWSCSRAVVPPNVHYWVPSGMDVELQKEYIYLFTEDLDIPPSLNITECGGDAAPATVYTITGPDGFSSSVSTDSNGISYQLPTGTECVNRNETTFLGIY